METVKKNAKWYLVGVLFLANVLIWYAIFAETRDGILTVAFLDVGQGDSIFIETSGGQQILIDGGPGGAVLQELGKVMPFYDRSIDVVIATHPDADHIGGLPEVLTRYNVGVVIEPGIESDTGVYKALEGIIEEKNIRKVLARRGMRLALDDGAHLLFLFPDRDVSGLDTNDASIVAKLVYGNTSFLLTGDASKKIEEYLIFLDRESVDTDVLKAGHHGSKTSSSESFVGYASPEYAIISAGADNRYGHPHQEVLDVFLRFGVRVLRTDRMGIIVMVSNGDAVGVK